MIANATTNGVLIDCSAPVWLSASSQDTELVTAPAGSAAFSSARSALICAGGAGVGEGVQHLLLRGRALGAQRRDLGRGDPGILVVTVDPA